MNIRISVVGVALFATAPISFAGVVGPSMYECFDAQQTGIGQAFTGTCTDESPFAADLRGGNFDYFHFEDWESIALIGFADPITTTGVTITAIPQRAATGVSVFGADQDDGVIDDSSGTGGQRRTVFGQAEIIFDAGVLSRLPTHVGFVATGAGQFGSDIRIEIFGPGDVSLGTIDNNICPALVDLGGDNCNQVSRDDLFYGFTDSGGIARMTVTDPDSNTNNIYLDHLQYGAIVPVPAAAWLFGSALGLLAWVRRRRVN